jgi:hypothetical protein
LRKVRVGWIDGEQWRGDAYIEIINLDDANF